MAPDLVQLPAEAADALAAQSQRLGAAALVARHRAPRRDPRRAAPLPRPAGAHRGHPRAAVPPARERRRPRRARRPGRQARTRRGRPAGRPGAGRPGDRAGQARRTRPAGRRAPRRRPPPTSAADAGTSRQSPRRRRRPAATRTCGAVWNDTVRPNLRGLTRALFASVEVVAAADDVVTLSAPNPTHQAKCEQQVADVERALREATGRSITVRWESASGADPTPAAQPAPASEPAATSTTSPTSRSRCSAAGRPCSNASPRRSPAPRSSARTTERWPTPSPRRCRR